jgi:hypothetical protein
MTIILANCKLHSNSFPTEAMYFSYGFPTSEVRKCFGMILTISKLCFTVLQFYRVSMKFSSLKKKKSYLLVRVDYNSRGCGNLWRHVVIFEVENL